MDTGRVDPDELDRMMQESVRAFVPPHVETDHSATGPIGFFRALTSNPISAIPQAAYREPVTFASVAGQPVPFVCDPDIIAEMLVRRHDDFPKTPIDERVLEPILGKGLFTAKGDDWRWKRRLTAPRFSPSSLSACLPGVIEPFEALARKWRTADGDTDISAGVTQATLDVIDRVVFGRYHSADVEKIPHLVEDYLSSYSWVLVLALLRLPHWTPHPGRVRRIRARTLAREIIGEVIEANRRQSETGSDICSLLLATHDPDTGRTLSDRDMVDMLITLIIAGHETGATSLAWMLYCLAMQPELQDNLRAEVFEVAGGRAIEHADLARMVKLQATIRETMRLFPAAPLIARRNLKPEMIAGKTLPPGTNIFIPIYAVHRHETLWERPGDFDMDRFLGPQAKKISRTAYLPFGAGPRICIGGAFSMMEMTAGMATLLRQIRFEPTDATVFEPVHRITLRPGEDLVLATRPV